MSNQTAALTEEAEPPKREHQLPPLLDSISWSHIRSHFCHLLPLDFISALLVKSLYIGRQFILYKTCLLTWLFLCMPSAFLCIFSVFLCISSAFLCPIHVKMEKTKSDLICWPPTGWTPICIASVFFSVFFSKSTTFVCLIQRRKATSSVGLPPPTGLDSYRAGSPTLRCCLQIHKGK